MAKIYEDTEIQTLQDFLNWIDKFDNNNPISSLVYRGQSNKNWSVIASVFRKEKEESILLDENRILEEASLKLWTELSRYKTYIEKLVFLQHYGLPTRLIDITFNPLIALYFACKDDQGDGAVFGGTFPWYCPTNNIVAELTAKFIFNNSLKGLFGDTFKDFYTIHRINNISKEDFSHPIFLKAPFNNPRIERQSGAFILSPLLKKETKTKLDSENLTIATDSIDDYVCIAKKRAIILSKNKKYILKQLFQININEGSLMLDSQSQIKAIIQKQIWTNETINEIKMN